jgi:hypothetical protein
MDLPDDLAQRQPQGQVARIVFQGRERDDQARWVTKLNLPGLFGGRAVTELDTAGA